jgi:hypothetical protein
MRAARFHGRRDIRVESDVPVPIPDGSRNEVLIEVEWCGICGSDLHEYTDGECPITHHLCPDWILFPPCELMMNYPNIKITRLLRVCLIVRSFYRSNTHPPAP